MGSVFDDVIDRYTAASAGFERVLLAVAPSQWNQPTPCTEWDVRQLVNHMTRGNINYVALAGGGSAADMLRLRGTDALGDDPVAAYTDSVRRCTKAFTRPGILDTILDYPLGRVPGRQALAVRATDSVIHTWDLARAIGGNEIPDTGLITWIDGNLAEIYAGLVETPTSAETTHQFFAAPTATPDDHASTQDRLLIRFGRQP